MSRVGKSPVPLPKGVEVSIADATISVKGPLCENFDWGSSGSFALTASKNSLCGF